MAYYTTRQYNPHHNNIIIESVRLTVVGLIGCKAGLEIDDGLTWLSWQQGTSRPFSAAENIVAG